MCGLSPALVFVPILSLLLQTGSAQVPTPAPGFLERTLYENGDPQVIFGTRGFAIDPRTDELYLALDSSIYQVGPQDELILVDDLGPGQDVGFLVRPTGSQEIFYSSLAGGTVYRRDLLTGATLSCKGPRFGFDLAVTAAGDVLVSANPFFPDPDNRIWLLVPGQGAPREVVRVSGPSGPLALDPAGNLLYATQSAVFPAPPGSTEILRFSGPQLAEAIAGGAPLTEADADVVLAGLDSAFDLALDDRQRLLISDAGTGAVLRSLPGMFALDPVPMMQVPGSALQMEFHGRDPVAPFAPYQPDRGGALHLLASDFQTAMEVRRAEPLRPTVSSSPSDRAGPGPIEFTVQDGPALGQAWLVASFDPPVQEMPLVYLEGLPLWVALDVNAPMVSLPLPLDQVGRAGIILEHPGGFTAPVHFQAAILGTDASGPFWGSSELYTLLLEL